eukprot:gene20754-25445_t
MARGRVFGNCAIFENPYCLRKSSAPDCLTNRILHLGEAPMATSRENHREDVIGRANVEDTPELLAYYDELDKHHAGALWTVANKIEPWEPKSQSVPVVWRYKDLRDHVIRSVDLVTPEKAGQRMRPRRSKPRRSLRIARIFDGGKNKASAEAPGVKLVSRK